MMEARRDVFQAIADPTRRQIIGMVADHPMNLNSIAGNFGMSRQAISLHIRILAECGLITIRQQGRERFCEARLDQLNEVSQWIDQYRRHREHRLDKLESYLHTLQKNKQHDRKK